MWTRFVGHVCLRNPLLPFLFGNSKLPLHTRSLRFLRAPVRSTISALNFGCIMPIPSLQLQKKTPISCRGAERLVMELWSPRFVTIQWLCSQFCHETASNQRISVEIELLAPVGWKWGCQPFSRPCSQNVMHCRKEICSTCLFKESIPAISFLEFQASTPYQKQVPESGSTLQSLRCNCRKRPVSCREAEGLVRKLWSPRFVRIQYSDWALSCFVWLLQIYEHLLRLSF